MKLNEIMVRSVSAMIKTTDNFKTVISDKTQLIDQLKELCMEYGIDGSDYSKLMNASNKNGAYFAELNHGEVWNQMQKPGPCAVLYVNCRAYADSKDTDRAKVGFLYRGAYSLIVKLPVDGKDTWFHRSLKIKAPAKINFSPYADEQIFNLVSGRSHNLNDHKNILTAGKLNPDDYFEMEEIFVAGWLIYQ